MELSSELIDLDTKQESDVLEACFAKALAVCATVLLIVAFAEVAEPAVLILGALLAATIVWLNTAQIVEAALLGSVHATRTSVLVSASGVLPWAFSAYLLFYRGLWHFTALRDGFSWLVIAESVAFTLLGYLLVTALYRLTDIAFSMNRKLPRGAH